MANTGPTYRPSPNQQEAGAHQMSDIEQNNEELKREPAEPGVDQTRRRLAGAAVGSGVILTLKSHPVLAGGGTYGGGTNECTKSALLSGNLSNHQSNVQCGCSAGYWGRHQDLWNKLTEGKCLPTDSFNQKFGCNVYSNNTTCGDVSQQNVSCQPYSGSSSNSMNTCNTTSKNTHIRSCAFQSVAALCNAYTFAWRFPLTPDLVKSKFKNAFDNANNDCGAACATLTTELDTYNNLYCGYDANGQYT